MTKRRGKRTSRGRRPGVPSPEARRTTDSKLELTLQRAERWVERDRPDRAIELLEPLVATTPDNPDLYHALGHARAGSGDIWGAMSAFEKALGVSEDPSHLLPLIGLYMEGELSVHALRACRAVVDHKISTPIMKEVHEAVVTLEQELARAAQHLDCPVDRVEQGLYDMETGTRALNEQDLDASIEASQRAIRRLGDWAPPHNNLSQALFYDGQPEESIREVRWVLSHDPQNVQALANGVRFLAWAGRWEEARDLWAQLEDVAPQDASERAKKGEAAAALAEHESVYRTLKPLDEPAAARELPVALMSRAQFFMAVAEANTGRRRQAEQRLKKLQTRAPFAAETLDALRAGQPGVGWAPRFRYFHILELLPKQHIDALLDLVAQEDDMAPDRFRHSIERFAERFPQIIQVAEQIILEQQQPEAGVSMLSTIGTPDAYAALRRFGESQIGTDQARLEALAALADAGEIDEGEAVRVWVDGQWRQTELRIEKASEVAWRKSGYTPRVIDLLNRGMTAHRTGDIERARDLFERVLELDPEVKEAYNNLGTYYVEHGEPDRAREMFRRAIEIDPLYVFAVGNMVSYLLDEARIEEAEALLAPLSTAQDLLPQEGAFYHFTRARIVQARGDHGAARQMLHTALEIKPDYEPARDMLEWLDRVDEQWYWEEQWERDRIWRERLQEKLNTLQPGLDQGLPLYSKEALIGMARMVMLRGGWSGLRKAELVDAIIQALTDTGILERIARKLSTEEQEALRAVLEESGHMAWADFDARFGNDVEESRYWQWHTPETTMGRLRLHGLLVEATVDDELHVVVPLDLRESLREVLA